MTTTPTVGVADESDRDALVETLTLAFSADPYIRWLFTPPAVYVEHFPEFVSAYGGEAFELETAYVIEGEPAVSLWLPPEGEVDDQRLAELAAEILPEEKQAVAWEAFGRLQECPPEEPHWHLPLVGVDPTRQGRGYGSAMLAHVTESLDERGELAYLESGNPRNLSLYARHGFELVETIQVGSMPPLFPMVREPAESRA